MVNEVEIGERYRVIKDNDGNFNPGDIVVALESSNVFYCVSENMYIKERCIDDYSLSEIRALMNNEVEEIKEGE